MHVTNRRTYRQVATDEYGRLMCGSHIGCPKKLSASAHHTGKVDGAGVIHWNHADLTPRRPGMRRFLMLVGWAQNDRTWERLPLWERLYRANVWATIEARQRFHIIIPGTASLKDRRKAERDAHRRHVKVRTTSFMAYQWMRGPRVYTKPLT